MEEEAKGLIKVWLVAVPSALAYSYSLSSLIQPGKRRLLAILPVVFLFILLPLYFSTVHLRGISAFFLCWLAPFKLLLFAFDRGPLCDGGTADRLSLPAFIAIASFPITIKQNPPPPQAARTTVSVLNLLLFAAKGLLLGFIVSLYPQRAGFHRGFVLALYCMYMYLQLDLVLAGAAAVGRVLLPAGSTLEPQFAAPYLSSSLQDFWGKGWNLVVSRILRSAVYDPVRSVWGSAMGGLAAFLVSGLMHEVMFFYLTLQPPTGEVSLFFVLHGICTAAEIVVKRWWRRRGFKPLPTAVAAPLTLGFVVATAFWLFLPQILRSDAEEQIINEAEALFSLLSGGI